MSRPLVCPYQANPVHYFDGETRKPCTGQCGHTFCLECVKVHKISRCPDCGLEKAFREISVNYTSIALIEECRKRSWEKWRGWMDTKTPDAGFCSQLFKEARLFCSMCVDSVKIPRICFTCDRETLFKLNRWQWHQSSGTILELLQKVMCTDCAINNHGEKGHKIVKPEMNKNSKKMITIAIAQKVLNMCRDVFENKKSVIDCFLRRFKVEMIGQYMLNILGELEYVEEWQCGYLGELINKELLKKYIENVDEKMLDLFGTEENTVCDCSRFREELEYYSQRLDVKMHRHIGISPQVFESGCTLYSWKFNAVIEDFSDIAATVTPIRINCPLCVYKGYSQHQKKEFLLENGVSIIGEFCKTEMIPLDKCCLNCLESLNDYQFLFSCDYQKMNHNFAGVIINWNAQKKESKKRKGCYQNCFMKDSALWKFVIINHMMADNNLYEVIMYEIEKTDGFVDCRLRKVRMKETVDELYTGLHSVQFWKYFDHWSKPIKMEAIFKSFKQQWNSFRFGNGEQEDALQCKCTVIWNKVLEKKGEMKEYEDLETTMIDMARYSMTEDIHGCPMEYKHGIEFDKGIREELKDAVGFESTRKETEFSSMGSEKVNCLMKRLASNIFPFAHLYCQNEEKQLFDNEIYQPYTGSCGHTICLKCVEKTLNGDCPVCGMEGSFEGHQLNEELVQEIETIKDNSWKMFKELWNNEAADSGACSKCSKSSSDLYICGDDNWTMVYACSTRLRMNTTADVLKFSRHILCEECALAQEEIGKKVDCILFLENYVPFLKNLKKCTGIFLLELLEEKIIVGDNWDLLRTEIQKNLRNLLNVLEEPNFDEKTYCGYDIELIKPVLIKTLIKDIDQSTKQLSMPNESPYDHIKEKDCPLCVIIDFLDCANNRSKPNWNNWMNVFEYFWRSQLPRFKKCCIRCLLHLKNRYNGSCQIKTEIVDMKNMGNAISEGIKEGQLRNFELVLKDMLCKDCIMLCKDRVDDEKKWQNLIIREFLFCLLQTISKGLSKTTFACHLQKVRIYNLVYHFFLGVCVIWSDDNQNWIVYWRFIKTSNVLKNLRVQFKKLRDEMNKEKIGVKCKCTDIWERNQYMMKTIGHEDCAEKREFQELEDSMEEMARFSLEEDLYGCPMEYNHVIELDQQSVQKLKNIPDSKAETNKNKCLCEVIWFNVFPVSSNSIEPNTTVSVVSFDQIVPLFINWWKYEASYPHLLCYACVERLELIQNRLGTLSGFYNCELRKMRMLKTFEELIMFIREYRMVKGRIGQPERERMTKVFNNFISQWSLFKFGSDFDHKFLGPGTVCHCTKTMDTSRRLQNANSSWEVRDECKRLREASERLSKFNLTKIIPGCPLNFDRGADFYCSDPRRHNKFTDFSDCSLAC